MVCNRWNTLSMKANRNKSVFRQYSRSLYTVSAFVFAVFSFAFLLNVVSIYFSTNKLQILNTIQPNLPSGLMKPTTADITIPEARIFRYQDLEVRFPKNIWDEEFTFSYEPSPFEHTKTLSSIMPSLKFKAVDSNSRSITKIKNPFEFTYTYSKADLKNIKEETIAFYLYDEQNREGKAIPTEINMYRKTATAQAVYVARYALMGEVKDNIAPTTYIAIEGKMNENNRYKPPITIKLSAEDNENGLGVEDTLYQLGNEMWKTYESPVAVTESGNYIVHFQSQDKAGNTETVKILEFTIE